MLQQRLLPGQFAGHLHNLRAEPRVRRRRTLGRLAVQCNIHVSVGMNARIASLGHFNGCFLPVSVNVDQDAESESEPADQQQGDERRHDCPPAARGWKRQRHRSALTLALSQWERGRILALTLALSQWARGQLRRLCPPK